MQNARASAAKQNDALLTPGAGTHREVYGAEGLGRAAGHLDLHELIANGESEEAAVGRPERRDGPLGAGEPSPLQCIEVVNPKAALISGGVEDELVAIGRNRDVDVELN